MYYLYDASGSIQGFIYNNDYYYFQKNLQGDIIRILDQASNVVTEYTYDAWGKVLSVTGTLADTVGQLNPFRYRGYYYDTETGFYYLQSRYYDPSVGRWINSDGVSLLGYQLQNLTQYNMFAYCFCDPINYIDDTGCYPYRIDDKGTHNEHIHVKYKNKNYSWYKIGHDKRHDDYGLEDVSNRLRKLLKKSGVPEEYFDKDTVIEEVEPNITTHPVQIPEKPQIVYGPPVPPMDSNIIEHPIPETYEHSIIIDPPQSSPTPNIETFPSETVSNAAGVLVICAVVYAGACVVSSVFTGGQSLWGLVVIA